LRTGRDESAEAISAEVNRFEPDVVLLDSSDRIEYGESWRVASRLHERGHPVRVIMFTCHTADLAEGRLRLTERSQRAALVEFVKQTVRYLRFA
jgi:hypothetical protein